LLETQLGVPLFLRNRKEIQLTPAGNRLLGHAENIVRNWERARHDIALEPSYSSMLALGSTLDLWRILLQERVRRLRRMLPETSLRIECYSGETLVQRLNDNLLDLAFLFEPPLLPGLEVEQVLEIPLVLVATRQGLSLAEAMSHNHILVDWGSAFALRHAELFADLPAPAIKVSAGTLALDLLDVMQGSAYLSRLMVREGLERGSLFLVEEAPVISRFAFAVYNPGNQRMELIRLALADLRSPV